MPSRDRLLAALVAVCWGINFPATVLALQHFPPLLMAALRFTLLAVPAVLFIPRPQIRIRWLLGVGVGIGVLQFGFLYVAMSVGMPGGLASLVLQASAPFTVIIAGCWLHERISARQAVGIAVAVLGLCVIAWHRAQVAAVLPVILTLCGALGWAVGNISTRQAKAPNPLQLTMWMSVVPPVPLLVLSLIVEGPALIGDSLATVFTVTALPSVLGLLYVVVIATVLGYGIWGVLLKRHPSSVVAPFSMLVPVVGVLASWMAFGETIDVVELSAGAAVVLGVLIASFRRKARTGRPDAIESAEPGRSTSPTFERLSRS